MSENAKWMNARQIYGRYGIPRSLLRELASGGRVRVKEVALPSGKVMKMYDAYECDRVVNGVWSEPCVITVSGGVVQLVCSFNWDASDPIQVEWYHDGGWHEPKERFRGMTDRQFWDVWCDWNGRMCGGIGLDDGKSEAEVNAILSQWPKVTVADIPDLADGTYSVDARL